MTTNHHGLLDPALIRPGRIDVAYELGKSGKVEVRQMARRFFPDIDIRSLEDLVTHYPDGALTPAEIQQALQVSERWQEAIARLRQALPVATPASLPSAPPAQPSV
jgi:SpoVK/Ycf46/Vps4 family AAA+-type ATPase